MFPHISKTQVKYLSNAPEVGSEPMLTGVSPMATPAAVACNQVESRHATRTIKAIFSLECFKTAWKHGKHSKLQKTQG